jgi:hypothetical protein
MRYTLSIPAFIFVAGILAACTATQIANAPAKVQGTVSRVAADIEGACMVAKTAAGIAAPFGAVPAVAGIMVYVEAACATEPAVAALVVKAVNDPSTVAWAQNLATDLSAAVAKVKSL